MDKLISSLVGIVICVVLSLIIGNKVITPNLSKCEDTKYEIVIDNERVCIAQRVVVSNYVDYDYYYVNDNEEYVTDGLMLTHIKDGVKTTITGSWAIRPINEQE